MCTYYISFFLNATPTSEIYTLSLHDALPISASRLQRHSRLWHNAGWNLCGTVLPMTIGVFVIPRLIQQLGAGRLDRKSTRLNSSHTVISYAVFCLKKKNNTAHDQQINTNSNI